MSSYRIRYSDELYHHGTKGQKWGVRRYQNEDGSLTPAGREHYYGHGFKVKTGEGASSNRLLGRKINASAKVRSERGQAMREEGRTKLGAIARGVGREAAAQIIGGAAASTLAAASLAGAPVVAAGAALAAPILTTGLAVRSISNAIRTYQDVSDISTAEGRYGNNVKYTNKRAQYRADVKTAKQARAARRKEINDKIDRGERDIESRSRGNTLSDKQMREQDKLYRDTDREWSQSDEQYKRDIEAAKRRRKER